MFASGVQGDGVPLPEREVPRPNLFSFILRRLQAAQNEN